MSVTISIEGDSDQSLVSEYDCYFCEDMELPENCPECEGTGTVRFTSSQWELNLSQFNFPVLWEKLGINPRIEGHGMFGEIAAYELLVAIEQVDRKVSLFKMDQYVEQLVKIAQEAKRRNCFVVWG